MIGLAWCAGADALTLGLLVTVLAAMVWRLADGPAGYQRDVTAATLIAVYVPFLAGFAALLAAPGRRRLRVLVTLAAVVLSDTGGYVGRRAVRQAPDGARRSARRSPGRASPARSSPPAVGSALLLYFLLRRRALVGRAVRAWPSRSRPCSATWPSR